MKQEISVSHHMVLFRASQAWKAGYCKQALKGGIY